MTGKNIRLIKFDSASVLHIPRASGGLIEREAL